MCVGGCRSRSYLISSQIYLYLSLCILSNLNIKDCLMLQVKYIYLYIHIHKYKIYMPIMLLAMFNNYKNTITLWIPKSNKQLANFLRKEWAENCRVDYPCQVKRFARFFTILWEKLSPTQWDHSLHGFVHLTSEFDLSLVCCWYSVMFLQTGSRNPKNFVKRQYVKKCHNR